MGKINPYRGIIDCFKSQLPPMYHWMLDITEGTFEDNGMLNIYCNDEIIYDALKQAHILSTIGQFSSYVIGKAVIPCLINKSKKTNQEEHKMYDSITVSCNGLTGTLEKLERSKTNACYYTLTIREPEKGVTHMMENVKPNEIKLVSGRVTMGG